MGQGLSDCQGKSDAVLTKQILCDQGVEHCSATSCLASQCVRPGVAVRRSGDHIQIGGSSYADCVEVRGQFCGIQRPLSRVVSRDTGEAPRLMRPMFEEDLLSEGFERVALVHCVHQELGGSLSTTPSEPTAMVKDLHDVPPTADAWSVVDEDRVTVIEFMARASASNSQAAHLDVCFNDLELLSCGVRLSGDFRLYRYEVPIRKKLWRIAFRWYGAPAAAFEEDGAVGESSSNTAAKASTHAVELDRAFGVRVQGQDIMHSLCLECGDGDGDETGNQLPRDWKRRSKANVLLHAKVRQGIFDFPRPVCVAVAESALEFVAYGKTGREQIDVYVNGMNVPCELSMHLGKGIRQLRRFALAPASVVIRSVVFVVRLGERSAGVHPAAVIEPSFGVMVGGQDCLVSAVHVDAGTGVRNPFGWGFDSPEAGQLRTGQWSWDGIYYLLAYRRTMRPHSRLEASGLKCRSAPRKNVPPDLMPVA